MEKIQMIKKINKKQIELQNYGMQSPTSLRHKNMELYTSKNLTRHFNQCL